VGHARRNTYYRLSDGSHLLFARLLSFFSRLSFVSCLVVGFARYEGKRIDIFEVGSWSMIFIG
jgi:hypothetical protein